MVGGSGSMTSWCFREILNTYGEFTKTAFNFIFIKIFNSQWYCLFITNFIILRVKNCKCYAITLVYNWIKFTWISKKYSMTSPSSSRFESSEIGRRRSSNVTHTVWNLSGMILKINTCDGSICQIPAFISTQCISLCSVWKQNQEHFMTFKKYLLKNTTLFEHVLPQNILVCVQMCQLILAWDYTDCIVV